MTYWNDLLVLQDISEELEKSIVEEVNFDDNDIDDFKESVLYFIEDWVNSNIKLYKEYKFEEIMYESIYDIILDNYGFMVDELSFDLESNIFDAMEIYFYKNDCFRSYSGTTIIKSPNKKKIKQLLKKWENVEQPEQLTEAWFKFRKEGLSASDIWKAVGSQSAKNSLIYSKCKPIDMQKTQSVNITSPFHNGHKYEPLSIMHYEYDFNTKVGEFGCKAHSEYPFLRASPDGINIDEGNQLYGRMVEVKNPVSRKLTGTPKTDYWIQMQLQMECWDLEECDFLETVFKGYEDEESFIKDGDSFIKTAFGMRKGIMIQFYYLEKPYYEYSPVDVTKKEFDKWYDIVMEKNKHMTWVSNQYWYLEDYSCVLVPRNKKWFNSVYPEFRELWDTILKERVSGFEHRKPKKNKKPPKLKKVDDDSKILFVDMNLSPKIEQNIVIKVRTESFDNLV
jgi:putative phage-type endonuclease